MDTFCCHFSLKTGAITAAVISSVATAIFILCSVLLFFVSQKKQLLTTGDYETYYFILGVGIGLFIFGIIALISVIYLIRAIIHADPVLLIVWISGNSSTIAVQSVIYLAFYYICIPPELLLRVAIIVIQIAVIIYQIYLSFVVRNYFVQLIIQLSGRIMTTDELQQLFQDYVQMLVKESKFASNLDGFFLLMFTHKFNFSALTHRYFM